MYRQKCRWKHKSLSESYRGDRDGVKQEVGGFGCPGLAFAHHRVLDNPKGRLSDPGRPVIPAAVVSAKLPVRC